MRRILATGLFLSFALAWASGGTAQHARRDFELHAESAKFWELIPRDARIVVVATGFRFTEGPAWDPAGFLYVSDEELNRIFRIFPDERKEKLISLGDPDGSTYDEQHRLLNCASILRAIIRISTDGKYVVLAD